MSIPSGEVDAAIVRLVERNGRFTVTDVRAELKVGPNEPSARKISNRVARLMTKMKVLTTDGIGERNRSYLPAGEKKWASFKQRCAHLPGQQGQPTEGPVGPSLPQEAPIRWLSRLGELDEIKSRLSNIETMVKELHSALFGQYSK